jgi:GNAT superfamily N-acetyltransferase
MHLAIRPGRDDDWQSMQVIFAQAGQAAWVRILPAAALTGLSAPERWHPRAGAHVLVAERVGDLIGFVCVRASADADAERTVGEVDGFYVRPALWGTGVGRALLAAGLEQLLALGFKEATLWTESRNERPLRIYRMAGWTLDGAQRRRNFQGTELLELRHRVTLGALRTL